MKEINQRRELESKERKTKFWMAHDPFIVDVSFLEGCAIVYGQYPSCSECGDSIKENDEVMWEFHGHKKRLVHLEHRPIPERADQS